MSTQESKSIADDVSPDLASKLKQSDPFLDQASDKKNSPIESTKLMNDDCLLAIFSTDALDLMDLCSLAETCLRFRKIAGKVIQNKLSICTKNGVDYEVRSGKYVHITSNQNEISRIFENFGASLSAVFVSSCSSYSDDSFVLDQATKHCVGNLRRIGIVDLAISEDITKRLKSSFKRLQLLHLVSVSIMGDRTLFEHCDELVEMKIIHVENDNLILENVFPKLDRFTYDKMADSIHRPAKEQSLDNLSTFITRHSTLKSFNLHVSFCDDNFKMVILQAIGNSCKQLKDLKISIDFDLKKFDENRKVLLLSSG